MSGADLNTIGFTADRYVALFPGPQGLSFGATSALLPRMLFRDHRIAPRGPKSVTEGFAESAFARKTHRCHTEYQRRRIPLVAGGDRKPSLTQFSTVRAETAGIPATCSLANMGKELVVSSGV